IGFFTIAAIFGRYYVVLLLVIEKTIGPAVVAAGFYFIHHFGGQLGILLFGIVVGKHVQLVAAMLHHEQLIALVVPVDPHYIADAGGIAYAFGIRLVLLVGPELPYAARFVEHGAGVLSFGACHAVEQLAGVERRADVYVDISLVVQYDRFGIVLL